jgi:hypothetical protein
MGGVRLPREVSCVWLGNIFEKRVLVCLITYIFDVNVFWLFTGSFSDALVFYVICSTSRCDVDTLLFKRGWWEVLLAYTLIQRGSHAHTLRLHKTLS